jgi:hypothetical protein
VFAGQRALMWPTLREWLSPYGAPTTITGSPTRTLLESAIAATAGPEGTRSSCSNDRSAAGSEATMCGHRLAAEELDGDLVEGLHYVRGGHDLAVLRDEYARTRFREAHRAGRRHVPAACSDHNNGRVDSLEYLARRLGAGRTLDGQDAQHDKDGNPPAASATAMRLVVSRPARGRSRHWRAGGC